MDLSVVIPIYNEESNIHELIERVLRTCKTITDDHEIILVDDGSKDRSLELIKEICQNETHVRFICLSRNFGHQVAVMAGLDHSKGDSVIIIDGDLQDPPELIPALYQRRQEGFDVVHARRISRKGETWFKKITAKIFYRLLRKITNINIPVDTGDFRLISRKVVDGLKSMPEKNKYIRGQVAWLGFKQTEVEFERNERKFGKTKYTFKKMMKLAMDGITGFSDKPLRFVTKVGFIMAFISFFIILYAIYSDFVLDQAIRGWTSIIITASFIGGIQLLSIGIIGEYISRINSNSQNRPLYMVMESNFENGNGGFKSTQASSPLLMYSSKEKQP